MTAPMTQLIQAEYGVDLAVRKPIPQLYDRDYIDGLPCEDDKI